MLLRNAELFCDVVACRSFSKAATLREISQPAVSQSLHQLEEYLGTTLIDRSKRPFELTAAGEIYYDGCRRLIDQFRRVEDAVPRTGRLPQGESPSRIDLLRRAAANESVCRPLRSGVP